MKTEHKQLDLAIYVSPQLYAIPVDVDAGFAQSSEIDDMDEVEDEW